MVLLKRKPAGEGAEPVTVEDLRVARPIGVVQNEVSALQLEKRSAQPHTVRTMQKQKAQTASKKKRNLSALKTCHSNISSVKPKQANGTLANSREKLEGAYAYRNGVNPRTQNSSRSLLNGKQATQGLAKKKN